MHTVIHPIRSSIVQINQRREKRSFFCSPLLRSRVMRSVNICDPREPIFRSTREITCTYIYIYTCYRWDERSLPQHGSTMETSHSEDLQRRTRGREGGEERRRVVIRYLGGGEGRLCQQLSGNGLALQITRLLCKRAYLPLVGLYAVESS